MANASNSGLRNRARRSRGEERLIAQLDFARSLVRTYFDPPMCTWEGRFHQADQECRRCADNGVCAWVFAQDPEPSLGPYTQEQLIEDLMFATGFLEGSMLEAGHETADCGCTVCTFVRENHAVISEH